MRHVNEELDKPNYHTIEKHDKMFHDDQDCVVLEDEPYDGVVRAAPLEGDLRMEGAEKGKADIDTIQQLVEKGGIDLQLLGVGRNGHIGFNESSSSLQSRTRLTTLARSTIEANAKFFDRQIDLVPKMSITMGVGTIMEANRCILLANGENKAEAVANAIEGPITASIPASALQMHPNTTILLDASAAKNRNG